MTKDHAMKVAKVRWVGAEQFIAVGPSGHAVAGF